MDIFVPGDFVYLPAAPEWGNGQVQSVVGSRVTVNFENAGKRVIETQNSPLEFYSHHNEP